MKFLMEMGNNINNSNKILSNVNKKNNISSDKYSDNNSSKDKNEVSNKFENAIKNEVNKVSNKTKDKSSIKGNVSKNESVVNNDSGIIEEGKSNILDAQALYNFMIDNFKNLDNINFFDNFVNISHNLDDSNTDINFSNSIFDDFNSFSNEQKNQLLKEFFKTNTSDFKNIDMNNLKTFLSYNNNNLKSKIDLNNIENLLNSDIKVEDILDDNIDINKFLEKDNINIENLFKNNNEEVKNDILNFESLIPKKDILDNNIIKVKVGDVININNPKANEEIVNKILMSNKNEFEIELAPKELGKLQIKLVFDRGETRVSILCENYKALRILSENSGSLVNLLENRTGSNTTVQVYEDKENFYNENFQGENNNQNQNKDQKKQKDKSKKDISLDFLQQMRLGLV